jgi:polar amino acid transport system substrate-binding protein
MRNLWAVFGLMMLLAAPVPAAEVRFVTVDAAPWASYDAEGRPVGAFPEIIAELIRRSGHRMPMLLQTFARIERDLEMGAQDCTILLWSEKRAHLVEMGEVVYPMPFGIIARKGVVLKRYEDLLPLTVSMVRGVAFDPRFEADTRIRRDQDKDYRQSLQKLLHGRVEAVSGALPTILYQAREAGMTDSIGDILELARLPLALQCGKVSPALAEMGEMSRILRNMVADGSLPAILARHGYR